MKIRIAMACFVLAASPLALAQDKAKDDAKKAAPAAEVKAERGKNAQKKVDSPKKERTEAQKANDERLKACNAQAGEKKGDARQKFMGSCMKAKKKADDDQKRAQQSRMASCQKQAGDKKMKVDDRKAFMKECLSTKP